MREETMNGRAPGAGVYLASVFVIAALVFLIIVAGCTTAKPAPTPVATTPPTPEPTPVPTTLIPTPTTQSPDEIADKAFVDAAEICFQNTPVISNLSSHLEFATCMKDTPLPAGNCARNFRYYALKYTNEDANTAGFARETKNVNQAREAFLRGEGYDGVRLEYVPCGEATLIKSSFYQ